MSKSNETSNLINDMKKVNTDTVSETKSIECTLCLNDINELHMYKITSCGHLFCIECLQEYVKYTIEETKSIEIKCPCKTYDKLLSGID